MQLREQNRYLSRERVLDLLQRWLPEHCDKVHRAGNWLWVIFPEKPSEDVRALLSQMGFHWNGIRKCWQHPCGAITVRMWDRRPRPKAAIAQAKRRAADGGQL